MKKLFHVISVVLLIFISCSCTSSAKEIQEVDDMFDSFEHNDNYVLLTNFELIIRDEHYKREDIKYNGKLSNIVFLEQEGYYSYTYDEENLLVEFLYTDYVKFKVEKIGALTLPSKLLDASWKDNCYWIRINDPTTEKYNPVYYCWDIKSKTITVKEEFYMEESYKYDADNFRNNNFLLESKTGVFNDYLEITDTDSKIKKTINKSILDSFEEGKKIKSLKSGTIFRPDKTYIDGRDFYITLSFGAGFLAEHYYCYVIKWNFDTEEVSFYTAVYFDYYQEWHDDFIILI